MTERGTETDGTGGRPRLVSYIQAVRRRWWIVLVCVVALPAAALTLSLHEQKQFSATASVDPQVDQKFLGSAFMTRVAEESSRLGFEAQSVTPQSRQATDVALVSMNAVLGRAARSLGGKFRVSELESKVSTSSVGNSELIDITASDHDPATAARIANTVARQYVEYGEDANRVRLDQAAGIVERQVRALGEGPAHAYEAALLRDRLRVLRMLSSLQVATSEIVGSAAVPTSASSPKPATDTGLAAVLGLCFGLALALLADRLPRTSAQRRESHRNGAVPSPFPAPGMRVGAAHGAPGAALGDPDDPLRNVPNARSVHEDADVARSVNEVHRYVRPSTGARIFERLTARRRPPR